MGQSAGSVLGPGRRPGEVAEPGAPAAEGAGEIRGHSSGPGVPGAPEPGPEPQASHQGAAESFPEPTPGEGAGTSRVADKAAKPDPSPPSLWLRSGEEAALQQTTGRPEEAPVTVTPGTQTPEACDRPAGTPGLGLQLLGVGWDPQTTCLGQRGLSIRALPVRPQGFVPRPMGRTGLLGPRCSPGGPEGRLGHPRPGVGFKPPTCRPWGPWGRSLFLRAPAAGG